MAETEAWTHGRLLGWTTDYLARHGSHSPRLDAEVLLAQSLGCQRIELYATFDHVPAEEARASFRELVRRRAAGMPVAYLVGRREFYSLSFHVTPDVLIPRPETEFLVMALVDLARERPNDREIAICDVGTGSGNIAVTVAKHLSNARVTAVDTSPAALEVARTNAAEHGVGSRIELVQSDLFSTVPDQQRFDFVVSNPPYVHEAEVESLPRNVRDYEPREALVAGPLGTEVIQLLVPQAAERLHAGGHLLLEIHPSLHDEVQALIEADGRFQPAPTVKDLAQLPRVVRALRK